jgi:5'-3' exonuclease
MNKIIASSDKDMYQLLDDTTLCYSFHKKSLIAKNTVYDLYKVTASNFALAKALCGDQSDNIPGVGRLGYKTLVKNVPLFATKEDLLLEELFDFCSAHSDESKTCKRIIDNKSLIERNWKLIYLDVSTLSHDQSYKIDQQVNVQKMNPSVIEFTKVLTKAGVKDFDVMSFFGSFNCIER